MLDKLHHALHITHPANLQIIKQYARWLRLRGYIKDTFFLIPQAHWISGYRARPPLSAHWV